MRVDEDEMEIKLCEHYSGDGGCRAVCGVCRAGTQDGRECVRLGICLGTHRGSLEDTHTHMQVHARTHTLD